MTEAQPFLPQLAPPKPLRIETVTLQAYRAFSVPETINLKGGNLVLFGENGAGKSSIFRALRDLFARIPLGGSLAANKHAYPLDAALTPKIAVDFNDDRPPVVWEPARHPGAATPVADPRIAEARQRASFLDYHALLRIHYHGDAAPNLFPLLVNELLADVVVDAASYATVGKLWGDIDRAMKARKVRPRDGGRRATIDAACAAFNEGLQVALDRLQPLVDRLLEDLGHPELKLAVIERGTVSFVDAFFVERRKLSGTELKFRFALPPPYDDRPQLFLNEARLSALALAIWLAGRQTSMPVGDLPDKLRLLVLDDVLISLDFNNRRPLLDVLRNHFSDWQIILLTHDRYWFETIRAPLSGEGWASAELYEMTGADGRTTPYLRAIEHDVALHTLNQAKQFLLLKHPPAAANYARTACEMALKAFCEKSGVVFPYKRGTPFIKFEKFREAAEGKAWTVGQTAALAAIKTFQGRVLNPLSHDPTTPLIEAEVAAAILAIEELMLRLKDPRP